MGSVVLFNTIFSGQIQGIHRRSLRRSQPRATFWFALMMSQANSLREARIHYYSKALYLLKLLQYCCAIVAPFLLRIPGSSLRTSQEV